MARITETIESPLRGDPLRQLTINLVSQLTGRTPYSTARATVRWNEQRNLVIESGSGLVSGNVRFTDGNPSTVRLQLDIDNGALRYVTGGIDRVRNDVLELAVQLQEGRAGASSSSRRRASATGVLNTIEAIMAGISRGLTPADVQAEEVEQVVAQNVAEEAPAPSMRPSNIGGAKGEAISRFQEQRRQGKTAQSSIPWGWVAGAAAVVTGGTALVLWVTRDKESF